MSKRNRDVENPRETPPPATKRREKNEKFLSVHTQSDYTVGWVCALPKEQTAATAMLDQRHPDLPKLPKDPNTYTLGAIGEHNIAITCLPKGKYGTISAATVAAHMISTFPSIKFGLMVGIGGGIPPKVRLGDVVVSTADGEYPGVVQWDMGKASEGRRFTRTGALDNPPMLLLTALSKLESAHELDGPQMPMYLDEMRQRYPRLASKYIRTDSLNDVLFKSGHGHVGKVVSHSGAVSDETDRGDDEEEEEEEEDCRFCDKGQIVKRKPRDMRIHYGLIASGNQVIRDATFRDKLNQELGGRVLCVEMEAAGLMNNFPCLVIRGICDYADSHKNKAWQEHSAAAAAAFAKELLSYVQPSDVDQQRAVKDLLRQVAAIGDDVGHIRSRLDSRADRDVLDWLTQIDYGPQQNDYLKRRQPGTGQWLLESEEFQRWLSASSQTLFCPGMPGAGKTILTSIVVDHLYSKVHSDLKIGIAYVYCNYQRHNDQKLDSLLASILKQLAESQSLLPKSVKELYDRHEKSKTQPSCDELLSSLQSLIATYSRIFLVIDALDECQVADGCRTIFLSELFKLQTKSNINILATSRDIPEISKYFKDNGTILEIRASPSDVARYLEGHMPNLPSFVQQDPTLQKEIAKSISEAVDGMFLLAQIYLGLLQDKLTPNDIRSAVQRYTRQGEDKTQVLGFAYEQALERINTQMPGLRKLAMGVLSWVTCAKRQLTTLELQHALATKPGTHELDKGDLPHLEDMVSVCAGLVTIDRERNIIRLVHYTTQEYLLQTQKQWFPDANSAILRTCVTYLSFSVFQTGFCGTDKEFEHRLLSNPLYDYAAHHWGVHAEHDVEPIPEVISFLQDQLKVEASCQALLSDRQQYFPEYSQLAPRNMIGLHLAAYLGVSGVVDVLFTSRVDVRDTFSRTPLWYAASSGHNSIVEELLAAGANVNAKINSGTALQLAASRGHIKMVDRLLVAGANVNAKVGSKTALELAVEAGHIGIVDLLLAAGANVNANIGGETALQRAATVGHLEIVDRLLGAGASVNASKVESDTALQRAARAGHLEIVDQLLAAGANVNVTNMFGGTALQLAAIVGHLEIVDRLLVAGGNVNASNEDSETVLHWAVHGGHLEIVNQLLAAGVNVNATDIYGDTALQIALDEGHLEIVNRLLAAGPLTTA